MSSSSTTNLGLFKATPNTGEPFDVEDVNDNWDKVDSAIGVVSSKFTTTTVSNTATETLLYSLPINNPSQGSVYRLVAYGTLDHASGATMAFRGKLSGTSSFGIYVVTYPASVLTNQAWRIELDVTVLTLGALGTWKGAMTGMARANGINVPILEVPSGTTTKSTLATANLELTAQWGAASASSVLRCEAGYAYRVTNA